jgi:hypothetical protein
MITLDVLDVVSTTSQEFALPLAHVPDPSMPKVPDGPDGPLCAPDMTRVKVRELPEWIESPP